MSMQPSGALPEKAGRGNVRDEISGTKRRRNSRPWIRFTAGQGIWGVLAVAMLLVPGPLRGDDAPEPGRSADSAASLKRAQHLEFDERLIVGQSLKSGAIYLFERKDSEIQSMVKIRNDFREELLTPLEPAP